jgi:RNA-binding protein 39
VGPVVAVTLIRDRASRRSKGMGYVEFDRLDVLPQALLLDGTKFCMKHRACMCSGLPLQVKPTGVERNYAAQAEAAGGSALTADSARRVYLLNLPLEMGEADLRTLGGVVGPVERATMLRIPGAGFLMYRDVGQVANALVQLHNIAYRGRTIKAGQVDAVGNVITREGEVIPLQAGRGDGLTPQARAALMATLSSTVNANMTQLYAGLTAAAAGGGGGGGGGGGAVPLLPPPPALLPPPSAPLLEPPLPTPCIVLSNVFDPRTETEAGWEEEVRGAIAEEAAKLGPVVFTHLDARDPRGLVFLMMQDLAAAAALLATLGGRSFAGRVVAAEAVPMELFITLFPASAQALQEALAAGGP